ncbi:MAG: CHAT domain-containing protein [Paracoccaceae bacterium]|jgi:CHAT domain-containing protein
MRARMSHLLRRFAAPAVVAALLTGCTATPDGKPTVVADAEGSALCTRMSDLVDQAQRFNFLTEFASAEAIWAQLSTTYSDPARDPAKECGTTLPPYSAVMANQALVYSNQRKFVAAEGMFRAAERRATAEAEAEGRNLANRATFVDVLRTQHNLNRAVSSDDSALREAGRIAQALTNDFDNAVTFSSETAEILQLSPDAQRRRVLVALSEFSRSFVFLQREEFAAAEKAIDKAIQLIAPVPGTATNYGPRFRTTKALLALAQGRPEEARDVARSAAEGFSEDLKNTALRARALLFQARAETQLGLTEEALATYEESFSIYENTAVPIGYDLIWPYFDLALKVMDAQPERRDVLTRRIFEAAQTLRSRATATSLAVAARDRAEGDGEDAAAIRDLLRAQQELLQLEFRRIAVERNPYASSTQKAEVRRQYQEAVDLLASRTASVEAVADDYLGLLSARTDSKRIQAAIRPDEALIQIIPGEPNSIAFVLTQSGIRAGRVGAGLTLPDIREVVGLLRSDLRGGKSYSPNFSNILYTSLIQPALALLGDEKPRSLIFSMADALTALPVETIATKASAIEDRARRRDFTDVEWMADKYEISYVPAPSTLADLRGATTIGKREGTRKVVAWGDFIPGVKAEKVLPAYLPPECLEEAQLIADLGALPASRTEMEILRNIFGDRAEIHTGAEFTEEAVKAESTAGGLAAADILHFSTHGFLPQSDDCLNQGGLTVTATDAADSDGVLTESEIRRLDLSGTELVVLTACDTAGSSASTEILEGNAAEGGEALSGLARAFFDAGARAALVTHWPIADGGPSLQLVETFYRKLDGGARYTEALRSAQAEVRSNKATSDPFYWAAFVLVGDGATGS